MVVGSNPITHPTLIHVNGPIPKPQSYAARELSCAAAILGGPLRVRPTPAGSDTKILGDLRVAPTA